MTRNVCIVSPAISVAMCMTSFNTSRDVIIVLPSSSVRDSLTRTSSQYAAHLPGSPAERYLAARGISLEVAATHLLGYVASPAPGDEHVVGRLSIPYLTPSGVLSLRYRTLADGPKYLSHVGDHVRPYNVMALHRVSMTCLITEGELDAIMAELVTGLPAVGIPGSQAWQPHFTYLFDDYDRVIVLADGDDAGRDLARKVCASLPNAMSTAMPDGLDVNDFVLNEGADALRARVGL